MGEFMEAFNKDLAESGELVETRGLAAPVHTRRLQLQNGVPVVTDGPYAETQEVLAGYWIVECESFDRATEIAARLAKCPRPAQVAAKAVADVRPIADCRGRSGALTAFVPGTEVEDLLRRLAPQVLGAVVAALRALRHRRGRDPGGAARGRHAVAGATASPDNPRGWLITVAVAPADRPAPQRAGPPASRGHRRQLGPAGRVAGPGRRPAGVGGRRHARPAVPVLPSRRCRRRRRSR